MSQRVIFRSKCPHCDNGKLITWIHRGCGREYHLDTDGYLNCDCGVKNDLLDMHFCCNDCCKPEKFPGKIQFENLCGYIFHKIDNLDVEFKIKLYDNVASRYHGRYGWE